MILMMVSSHNKGTSPWVAALSSRHKLWSALTLRGVILLLLFCCLFYTWMKHNSDDMIFFSFFLEQTLEAAGLMFAQKNITRMSVMFMCHIRKHNSFCM